MTINGLNVAEKVLRFPYGYNILATISSVWKAENVFYNKYKGRAESRVAGSIIVRGSLRL